MRVRHTALALVGVLSCALMARLSSASCPLGLYNGKICSGNGVCTPQNLCKCDNRHVGFDCSQRTPWCFEDIL